MRRVVHGDHVFHGRIVLDLMRGREVIAAHLHHDFQRVFAYLLGLRGGAVGERTRRGNTTAEIQPAAESLCKIRGVMFTASGCKVSTPRTPISMKSS